MTVTQEKTQTGVVPLPLGHVACNACGSATPGSLPDPTKPRLRDIPEALCDKCVVIRAEANALVSERPRLSARYGSIINQRVECLLHIWRVLGVDPFIGPKGGKGDPDIAGALTAYGQVLNLVWWARGDRAEAHPKNAQCAAEPYAFLTSEERKALREARKDEILRHTAKFMPDAEVACPSGHCILCGTTRPVKVSAEKMMKAGGYEVVQRRLWLRVVTNATALGSPKGCPRATLVEGHLCHDCQSAIGPGSPIGPIARAKAVRAYVTAKIGPGAAARLDDMLDQKYGAPTLPAAPWEHPSGLPGPWAHLHGLFDVLKRP